MFAIIRRELQSYFSSPIGYIYLAVFYAFAGYYFVSNMIVYLAYGYSPTTDISGVFSNLFLNVLFMVPILTMRLFSEDKKYRTDQALLTAPISLTGLVMGKFLACVAVFLMGMVITLVFGFVIALFAPPNWASIMGNFIALLMMGMAFISIGIFISSMTENQVVAAIGAFAAALGLIMIENIASSVTNPTLQRIISSLSFNRRYSSFTNEIFDLGNLVFFLSVCAVFLFLTIRVLEKRRWS